MSVASLASVITTAYNAEGFIAEATASVQAQSLGDWEILVAAEDLRVRLIRLDENAAVAALTGNLTIDHAPIRKWLGWPPAFSVEEGLTMTFRDPRQDAAK